MNLIRDLESKFGDISSLFKKEEHMEKIEENTTKNLVPRSF